MRVSTVIAILLLFCFYLKCYSQSNREALLLSQTLNKWNTVLDIDVDGTNAFLAVGTGISIVDISDPTDLQEIGFFVTSGYAKSVEVSGNYLYIGYHYSGSFLDNSPSWTVIDISNPVHPIAITDFAYQGHHPDIIKIVNGIAYCLDTDLHSFYIFDVTNITVPVFISNFQVNAYDFSVTENHIFFAGGNLYVYDVSNMTQPLQVCNYNTPGAAFGVEVAGSFAYVADNIAFSVLDVSNPAAPQFADSIQVSNCRFVKLAGNRAVIKANNYMCIVNIQNPADIALVSCFDSLILYTNTGIAVAQNHVYLSVYQQGLHSINITNPAAPFLSDSYYQAGAIYDIALDGNIACVLDNGVGLHLIDISNPAQPMQVYCYNTPEPLRNVSAANGIAYVGMIDQGEPSIRAYNISVTGLPGLISEFTMPAVSNRLWVENNLVYAGCADGLRIINYANLIYPEQVGFYATQAPVLNVCVQGNYAYLACPSDNYGTVGGVYVLNVANPAVPQLVGTWVSTHPGTFVTAINVEGNYACVLSFYTPSQGPISFRPYVLNLLDMQDPANPVQVAEHFYGSMFYHLSNQVEIVNGLAYLNFQADSLYCVNISDPDNMIHLGGLTTGANRFKIDGNSLFTVALNYFRIYDVSDVVPVDEEYIDHNNIMGLYDNSPNPFKLETVIRYYIKQGVRVRLSVYNIKGQLVRELVNVMQKEGDYQANWDGTDCNNKKIAPGIYFFRLEAGKCIITKKGLLLK